MPFGKYSGGVTTRASSRRISVRFLDKKTGKVRHFKARVKRSKYATTEAMIKGMAANGMHPSMIVQAVIKREKIGKAAAKKYVIKVKPSLEKKFDTKAPKRKSASKSKKRKSNRPSRRNQGGARTQRQSRWW